MVRFKLRVVIVCKKEKSIQRGAATGRYPELSGERSTDCEKI